MRAITEKRTARLEQAGQRLGCNSTIALPSTPGRHQKAKPRKPITSKKPRKPMPKVNVARQAKRKAAYAKKLAAYRKSATYRAVEARSGGQCEAAVGQTAIAALDIRAPLALPGWQAGFFVAFTDARGTWFRCEHRAKHHHHLRYMRLGGDELPEDMLHVCTRCHDFLESQKPAGNRRSRHSRTTRAT